jgi:hypothetical protein
LIALLQSKVGGFASGLTPQTSTAVGYTANTTAGSLLVCVVYNSGATGAQAGAPVTSGFTWTLAEGASSSTPFTEVQIYYIANAASMASSVTTTASASALSGSVAVEFELYEFSNVATTSPVDTIQATSNGTAATPSTPSLVTTAQDLIIVVVNGATSGAGAAGSGYTLGITSSHQIAASIGQTQYILNQPSGTIATSGFGTGWTKWGAAAVAFLA